MNKFQKRRIWLTAFAILFLGTVQITAQKRFEVESFTVLGDDLNAHLEKGHIDEDGDKCAIIKIHTTEKDLVLESGDASYDIESIDMSHFDQIGEIWIYVPKNAKKLKFQHKNIPEYRYPFPERIEAAKVYSLVLVTNNPNSNSKPYLVFNTPKIDNLRIFVDNDEIRMVNGTYSITLEEGEHSYRVEADGYETKSDKITLENEPLVIPVELKRQFGFISVESFPTEATVSVNGTNVGQTNYVSERVKLGQYNIHVEKEDYFPVDTFVTVTAEKDGELRIPLVSSLTPPEGRRTLVMLEAGYHPSQISFGAMVGMVETNGAYLRFRSDFGSASTDLECDDTGYLTAGGTGLPYYKEGATSKARMSITAGYLRRIAKPLYLYVGVGYGSRTLAWETIDGELVKNTDHSATGVAGEIGAIGRFGKFALSVGYQTVNFKYHEASLGIGFMF